MLKFSRKLIAVSPMKLFSHRKGLKKVRTEIQVDSIDETLRNRLWNALDTFYWERGGIGDYYDTIMMEMKGLLKRLWDSYFRKPLDTLSSEWSPNRSELRNNYFGCEWYEVYDFIEFVANNYKNEAINERFMKTCNEVLGEELSAYRFVGKQITQITSEEEISEIEEALETPLKPVRVHLEKSLELISDRKSPDYRNSIKESISAVEAICRLITKDKKATLGQALKKVKTKVGLHRALEEAFSHLYGYTSSEEGIRHSLMDEPTLDFEDAKFMLVSCSAFINYLISKGEKAQIEF